MIAVTCDNDSIHHAHKITGYLEKQPRLELLYGARYSPHDNPADAGHRRALDQPLAASGIRAELLECRLAGWPGEN